jgi:hypothetical protein
LLPPGSDNPDTKIVVREKAYDEGFDVIVVAAPDGESFDRSYADYRRARGYAFGLKMVRGWPIVDEIGRQP